MVSVLSTKKLSSSQKNLLLNSGIGLVEYDAIKIDFIDFETKINSEDNLIFTSKNGVKAFLDNYKSTVLPENLHIFCVGTKTKEYLESQKWEVLEFADYSKDLSEIIVRKYADRNFKFFCGASRRDELPSVLKEKNIPLEEIEVYTTGLNNKKFDQDFDGIMFFSPSGIESYLNLNELNVETCFCIGRTTASAIKNKNIPIVLATTPSIENVIVQVVKHYK